MDERREEILAERDEERLRYLDALLDLRPLLKYGSVNDWRRMEQILDSALASYLEKLRARR